MKEPSILLVEDSPELGGDFGDVCETFEIPLEVVANIADALLAIARNNHNVVVLDDNLNGKSEAAALVAAIEICKPRPITIGWSAATNYPAKVNYDWGKRVSPLKLAQRIKDLPDRS